MRRENLVGIAITSFVVLPISIIATLKLQFIGSLLGFFVGGCVGGYLTKGDRSEAFSVGLIGSMLPCLSGLLLTIAILSSPSQYPIPIMYVVSYILWLNFASPVNLMVIVIIVGGIGAIIGKMLGEKKKGEEAKPPYTGI